MVSFATWDVFSVVDAGCQPQEKERSISELITVLRGADNNHYTSMHSLCRSVSDPFHFSRLTFGLSNGMAYRQSFGSLKMLAEIYVMDSEHNWTKVEF